MIFYTINTLRSSSVFFHGQYFPLYWHLKNSQCNYFLKVNMWLLFINCVLLNMCLKSNSNLLMNQSPLYPLF